MHATTTAWVCCRAAITRYGRSGSCLVTVTRLNILAYRTLPTVLEIVVVHSTAIVAEILRRMPDGTWPRQPEVLGADGELRLTSIEFAAPLREAYRTSGLS
jgi:lambda repressor-like predicted transcriptional regulator